jgi:hypothetical protein
MDRMGLDHALSDYPTIVAVGGIRRRSTPPAPGMPEGTTIGLRSRLPRMGDLAARASAIDGSLCEQVREPLLPMAGKAPYPTDSR